jgi:transaldolase/glucose-6-phosphate isomerase
MSKLTELINYGQSYWLDDLSRSMIKSGELKKRITQHGLRGMTSNPTIFYKAISKGQDYDGQIKQLVKENCPVHEIYEKLTVNDVQDACDLFTQVYDESGGSDGFVSLEVSPYLAHDTEGTIREVRRLFGEVSRPNCFIKIPGTAEGVPAIEQMLYEGININITLLFSIESYEAVANAYVNALERRDGEGKQVNNVSSVASFFLSRIDVLTDQLLSHRIKPSDKEASVSAELLLGKAAIANAKLAYWSFKRIFNGSRWQKLAEKGARVQRPLWASTSTKDPLYEDTKYVDTLIGPDTVNTLPEETIIAFEDHGILKQNAIEDGMDESERIFSELRNAGIDISFVTKQLENEGVQKFIDSYNELMEVIADKRKQFLRGKVSTQSINYGNSQSEVKSVLKSLDDKLFSQRLFNKDPYLWTEDKATAELIYNRLGWLESVQDYQGKIDELESFAQEIVKAKYRYAVLLGMGGSSLCPDVSAQTFGSKKGYPELFVLDNTSPEAIRNVEREIDLAKTLFIVSSKSGTTTETLCFYRYFYEKVKQQVGDKAGDHFIAITDPGTPLETEAVDNNFRRVFKNRSDIGGRYSAISYFGLVPMALIGMDIRSLLDNAHREQLSCGPFIPSKANPGITLGALLGFYARRGRDKVTFIVSESIHSFGYWVEQLIAESTGKLGKGLVPVESEPLERPGVYENDRIFIHIYLSGDKDSANKTKVAALEKAGHPVVRIELNNKLDLGGEYFRWEVATATAGMIIGENPFDEPNVAESKKNTNEFLGEGKRGIPFFVGTSLFKKNDLILYYDQSSQWFQKNSARSFDSFLKAFLRLVSAGDYFAMLPYFPRTPARHKLLQGIRKGLLNSFKIATTLGYGPRYLHSTGQLHKGGPNKGVFIIFTADSDNDIAIPGERYGFGMLQRAQAFGDNRSLINKGRRVIRIHLGSDIEKGLRQIQNILK